MPPSLRTAADLARFVGARPALLGPLRTAAALALPDCWIGAGFLRNPVWDALCGLHPGANPPGDVDVVWFDPTRADPAGDEAAEAALAAAHPGPAWSVRNQARMAARNRHPPYAGTLDAVSHWPETATAVVARWTGAVVEVAAPHGLDDLLGRVVRPTPRFAAGEGAAVVAVRAAAKGWTRRWPGVTIALPAPPQTRSPR